MRARGVVLRRPELRELGLRRWAWVQFCGRWRRNMVVAFGALTLAFCGWVTARWVRPPAVAVDWRVQAFVDSDLSKAVDVTELPGTLYNGDSVRIEARFSRPVYACLCWVASEGEVSILFPEDARWARRVNQIRLPARREAGFPVAGPAGTEIAVLLYSDKRFELSGLRKLLRPGGPLAALPPRVVLQDGVQVAAQSQTASQASFVVAFQTRGLEQAKEMRAEPAVMSIRQWFEQVQARLPAAIRCKYIAVPHASPTPP